jgi:hypothetical protein
MIFDSDADIVAYAQQLLVEYWFLTAVSMPSVLGSYFDGNADESLALKVVTQNTRLDRAKTSAIKELKIFFIFYLIHQ